MTAMPKNGQPSRAMIGCGHGNWRIASPVDIVAQYTRTKVLD